MLCRFNNFEILGFKSLKNQNGYSGIQFDNDLNYDFEKILSESNIFSIEDTIQLEYKSYKIIKNNSNVTIILSKLKEEIPDDITQLFIFEITSENIASMLVERKQDKITESKTMLQEYLTTHPLESTAHGGVLGTYTVTKEKQDQMNRELSNYLELLKVSPNDAKLMWNEAGKEAVEWTEAEFRQLMLEIQNYVRTLVSKQQQLEVMINNCTTIEEVDAIVLSYE